MKPGNLLITPEGHAKLLDLGLVFFLQQEDDELRDIHNGKIVGTADYLAPEQIMAPEAVSPVSDIYSLGCTLYYAVTGKVPFPGGTAKDKAKAHCRLQPITPRRWNPELSEEFIEVIHRMMAKDPVGARADGDGGDRIAGAVCGPRLEGERPRSGRDGGSRPGAGAAAAS